MRSLIEDQLRSALSEAPVPTTVTPDPLADLQRRLGRARIRYGALALAVVVVLVAAVVVPLTLVGSSSRDEPAVAHPRVMPWDGQRVYSFATGGGYVWTVASRFATNSEKFFVQRRDPVTGKVLSTFPITTPEQSVAYGGGLVWTWGGGDGGYPAGVVDVHAPSGTHVGTVNLGKGKGIKALAIAPNGNGFGVREDGRAVVEFDRSNLASARTPESSVRGAQNALVAGTNVLVVGRRGVITSFPLSARIDEDGPGRAIRGVPIATTADGVWARVKRSLVYERLDGAAEEALPTPGEPIQAVVAPDGGLYVLYRLRNRAELAYYSPVALRSSAPRPTATTSGSFDHIAMSPAGGIVVGKSNNGSGNGTLARWDPQ